MGEKLDMPVLHLPQLVGLALGLSPQDLRLDRHMVKTQAIAPFLPARVIPACDPVRPRRATIRPAAPAHGTEMTGRLMAG